jgi:hypothetical protein
VLALYHVATDKTAGQRRIITMEPMTRASARPMTVGAERLYASKLACEMEASVEVDGTLCSALAVTRHWLIVRAPNGGLVAQMGGERAFTPLPVELLVSYLRRRKLGIVIEMYLRHGSLEKLDDLDTHIAFSRAFTRWLHQSTARDRAALALALTDADRAWFDSRVEEHERIAQAWK